MFVGILLVVGAGLRAETPPFPDVEFFPLSGGDSVRIDDFEDHLVLMTFWASWCGPCRLELPELAELAHEFEDRGLVVLAVSLDASPQAGIRFLERGEIDIDAYRIRPEDQDVIGVTSIPTTILLDGNAMPIKAFQGYSPTVVHNLRKVLVEAYGATPPTVKEPR